MLLCLTKFYKVFKPGDLIVIPSRLNNGSKTSTIYQDIENDWPDWGTGMEELLDCPLTVASRTRSCYIFHWFEALEEDSFGGTYIWDYRSAFGGVTKEMCQAVLHPNKSLDNTIMEKLAKFGKFSEPLVSYLKRSAQGGRDVGHPLSVSEGS